jgi:hypothetical protein
MIDCRVQPVRPARDARVDGRLSDDMSIRRLTRGVAQTS